MNISENLTRLVQKGKQTFLPNGTGHYYKVSYSLGKFTSISLIQIINEMKAGKIFPLVIKEGSFNREGAVATLGVPYYHRLKFLPFCENNVRVKKINHNGILLEAVPKHIFQGVVFHKIRKNQNQFFYELEGKGIPNESYFSYFANTAFIKLGFMKLFVKMNVESAVKKLEKINKTMRDDDNIERI